jgi:hypothetical protein
MRTITVQKTWTTEATMEIEDDEDTNSAEFCEKVDAIANDHTTAEWDFTSVLEDDVELWNI